MTAVAEPRTQANVVDPVLHMCLAVHIVNFSGSLLGCLGQLGHIEKYYSHW